MINIEIGFALARANRVHSATYALCLQGRSTKTWLDKPSWHRDASVSCTAICWSHRVGHMHLYVLCVSSFPLLVWWWTLSGQQCSNIKVFVCPYSPDDSREQLNPCNCLSGGFLSREEIIVVVMIFVEGGRALLAETWCDDIGTSPID